MELRESDCGSASTNMKSKEDAVLRYFNLLDPTPMREYFEHESDIIDVAW
jgi:hypothetical protein